MTSIKARIFEDVGQEGLDYYIKIHLKGNSLFDFSGHNCNNYEDQECIGWNGKSKRCECGNRRVMWVFEDGSLYAKAY